jgi:hypothetical protein
MARSRWPHDANRTADAGSERGRCHEATAPLAVDRTDRGVGRRRCGPRDIRSLVVNGEAGRRVRPTTAIRTANLKLVVSMGFKALPGLPIVREEISALRPARDLATRRMALDALFTWVAETEHAVAGKRVRTPSATA